MHYQRIAHRDVKPANLLLGEGRVQVADLGACGELAGAGTLAGAVGTPAFRAPEAMASPDTYKGEVSGPPPGGTWPFSFYPPPPLRQNHVVSVNSLKTF